MKLKNKIKKIIALFTMILLVLCGCKQPTTEIAPTSLTVSSSEVKVIVNSIRDLNDIVTLRFEPKEATQRDVVWSAEENDVFTLEVPDKKDNPQHILQARLGQRFPRCTQKHALNPSNLQ